MDLIKNIISKQIDFPFDIEQVNIDNDVPLDIQLDEVFCSLRNIYQRDPEISDHIERIYISSKFFCTQAPLFDLNENTRGNGYWTMLKLLVKFGKILATPDLQEKIGRLHILNIFKIIDQGTKICIQLREGVKEPDESCPNYNLFTSHIDFQNILDLMQSLKPQLNSLHEFFNFCWLGSMSRMMQLFTTFMAIYSTQWKSFKIYNWFSRKNRAQMFTNMILNVNVDCLKSMWNITEFPLVRICLPSFWYQCLIDTSNIYCPRQQRWIIDATKPIVHDLQNESNIPYPKMKKPNVRCLLLRCKNETIQNRSLIIHIHGGGFISQSPESHAVYLINWVKKLKNIPILSIDYTLSPEAVFPEALQEILDCYLWLLSGDPAVYKELGFHPDKIIICGDSAGGNFSMVLMVILSHIQKKLKNFDENLEKYRYPNGLFLFYSPFVLSTMISPSRILTSMDGLVPLGTLLNCLAAYLPDEIFDNQSELNKFNVQYEDESIISKFTNFIVKLKENFKHLLKFQMVNRTKPWFRRTENLKQSLNRMNKFLTNPFISPLLLENIDFNHIPLYLYPLTYDSFLDDSIEMAKKWQKDKVHIEFIDEVPHGFLNFIDFNRNAKKASYHCIEPIRDILS